MSVRTAESLLTALVVSDAAPASSVDALQGKQNGTAASLSAASLLVAVGTAAGSVKAISAATARHSWSAQNCNEGYAEGVSFMQTLWTYNGFGTIRSHMRNAVCRTCMISSCRTSSHWTCRAGLVGIMLLQGRGLADVCSRRRQQRAAVQRGRRLQCVCAGRCERSRGHEVQGRQPCAVLCWRHTRLPVCAGGQQLARAVEHCPAEAPRKVHGAYGGP